MIDFLAGVNTALFLVAALFFVRFRRTTGDPLFASFAAGFALMALHQWSVLVVDPRHEHASLTYLVRIAAYVVILAAILGKNIAGRR